MPKRSTNEITASSNDATPDEDRPNRKTRRETEKSSRPSSEADDSEEQRALDDIGRPNPAVPTTTTRRPLSMPPKRLTPATGQYHTSTSETCANAYAGIAELSLKDGADRKLNFSMIIPLSVYPNNWRGKLKALHYRNWQVILGVINQQQSDFLPSKYLEELREDREWVRDTIRRWFRCHGASVQECAGAVSPHGLYAMCGLMGFANTEDGREDMLRVILDSSQVELFFALWPNKRASGTARRRV